MTHGKNDLRDEHIAVIRVACISANPDRAEVWQYNTGAAIEDGSTASAPCRLADVLIAIEQVSGPMTWKTPEFQDIVWQVLVHWNLRTDNLMKQGDECLALLASLLK